MLKHLEEAMISLAAEAKRHFQVLELLMLELLFVLVLQTKVKSYMNYIIFINYIQLYRSFTTFEDLSCAVSLFSPQLTCKKMCVCVYCMLYEVCMEKIQPLLI